MSVSTAVSPVEAILYIDSPFSAPEYQEMYAPTKQFSYSGWAMCDEFTRQIVPVWVNENGGNRFFRVEYTIADTLWEGYTFMVFEAEAIEVLKNAMARYLTLIHA